jgi:hypothetical protein
MVVTMTTIAFLSLFFGLIRGPYPVELAVNGPVAAVELVVDGKSVQTLQAPPWKTRIDFGPDLLPHEIVARALDAKGAEIARAEEWANLPHPLAKVDIVLEEGKLGPPKAARVVWKDLKGEEPSAVLLLFDGVPVPLDATGRGALPAHDLKSLHVLTAEVVVPPGRSLRREIAYGGEYGSEVSTELTAVPVRVRQGKLPPAAQLGGWFTAAGSPLPVDAVEEGPAQLYVVRSPGAQAALWQTAGMEAGPKALRYLNLWDWTKLGKDDVVRFVDPYTQRFEADGELSDLFPISADFKTQHNNLLALLLHNNGPRPALGIKIRFADAVAVAAQEAVTENRRRAVLLVLTAAEKDQSNFDLATVRRYLAALHVPLFVWCLGEPEPGSAAATWGKVDILKRDAHLRPAFVEVRDALAAQRIVMVDGRILPQSIALSPVAAKTLELIGATP